MRVIEPKSVRESTSYMASRAVQTIQVAIAVMSAVSALEVAGVHPLRAIGFKAEEVNKFQSITALIVTVAGTAGFMKAGEAKDGRVNAESPVYREDEYEAEPVIKVETVEEKEFFADIKGALGRGLNFNDAVKEFAQKDSYHG